MCTNCHGAHDMRPKSDPESRVARANIPDTCGSCHMNVKEKWEDSQHGKLRQANVLAGARLHRLPQRARDRSGTTAAMAGRRDQGSAAPATPTTSTPTATRSTAR